MWNQCDIVVLRLENVINDLAQNRISLQRNLKEIGY